MDALSNPDKQEGRSHFTWLLAYKTVQELLAWLLLAGKYMPKRS